MLGDNQPIPILPEHPREHQPQILNSILEMGENNPVGSRGFPKTQYPQDHRQRQGSASLHDCH